MQQLQGQLTRLACATNLQNGAFDAATIQGLRRASLLTDDRYLWHRPTMAALRALKKIDARDGCPGLKIAAAPRCLASTTKIFVSSRCSSASEASAPGMTFGGRCASHSFDITAVIRTSFTLIHTLFLFCSCIFARTNIVLAVPLR